MTSWNNSQDLGRLMDPSTSKRFGTPDHPVSIFEDLQLKILEDLPPSAIMPLLSRWVLLPSDHPRAHVHPRAKALGQSRALVWLLANSVNTTLLTGNI